MNPKACLYYITLKCNDTCEFCEIWNDDKLQSIEEAPIETHLENLKSIKSFGVRSIEVTGGEPLLFDALPQFLDGAKDAGYEVSLITNGIKYYERAKEIKGKIDKLFFSLDYPIKDEHDRSRGTECFVTVMRSINYAKELGEKPKVIYTITRDSIRFLPEMVEVAEKLKLELYLNPVYDFSGLHGFQKSSLDHIKYYFKRPGVIVDLAMLEFIEKGGNNIVFPRCRARETTITCLPDGSRAIPCFFNNGGKEGKENICIGCARWPYMLPSFASGLDKCRLLHEYSRLVHKQKEAKE